MLVALGWLAGSGVAAAQTAEASPAAGHADFQAVIGWQNLRLGRSDAFVGPDTDWAHAIFYGGAGAGWYWTDHHKTQVDFGGGTPARQYRYGVRTVNGVSTSEISRVRVTRPALAISQQYQFFRNEWFHPRVGVGLEVARETRTEVYDPVFIYDSAARVSREIAPRRSEGPEHRVVVRPFAETGFKAYMNRRAFFTGDMRLTVHNGVDQALFRIGFGVDF
jgi:hypothetical protein